jgi:hypothetical protein
VDRIDNYKEGSHQAVDDKQNSSASDKSGKSKVSVSTSGGSHPLFGRAIMARSARVKREAAVDGKKLHSGTKARPISQRGVADAASTNGLLIKSSANVTGSDSNYRSEISSGSPTLSKSQ